jgi:hypothetical protein
VTRRRFRIKRDKTPTPQLLSYKQLKKGIWNQTNQENNAKFRPLLSQHINKTLVSETRFPFSKQQLCLFFGLFGAGGHGGRVGWWQLHLITYSPPPPLSIVICCFSSALLCLPNSPRAGIFFPRYFPCLVFFSPLFSATVLHKPIILIASLVPLLHPLSVVAINRTERSTTVIGGPCPSDGTQFFVWPIFISNKWSDCASEWVGFVFIPPKMEQERCFVELSGCSVVTRRSGWVRNGVVRYGSCVNNESLLSSIALESDLRLIHTYHAVPLPCPWRFSTMPCR